MAHGHGMPCPYGGTIKSKFKDAREKKQAAATLRSCAAGSQDESRCSAIHKFKSKGNGWRSEDRRYNGNGKFKCDSNGYCSLLRCFCEAHG